MVRFTPRHTAGAAVEARAALFPHEWCQHPSHQRRPSPSFCLPLPVTPEVSARSPETVLPPPQATFLSAPHIQPSRERNASSPLWPPLFGIPCPTSSAQHFTSPAAPKVTSISVAGADRLLSLFFFTAPQYVTLLSAVFPSLRVSDTLLSWVTSRPVGCSLSVSSSYASPLTCHWMFLMRTSSLPSFALLILWYPDPRSTPGSEDPLCAVASQTYSTTQLCHLNSIPGQTSAPGHPTGPLIQHVLWNALTSFQGTTVTTSILHLDDCKASSWPYVSAPSSPLSEWWF